MKFDTFKIRCSALGKLLTEPKLKADKESGNLSATAKDYLNSVWIEEVYGRKKDTSSKYTEKGQFNEQDTMDLYCSMVGRLIVTNKIQFENEYITGTPDLFDGDIVVDLKSSWDIWTYMKAEVTNDYFYQLLGYMWLTGKQKASLCYGLTDCPEHMVQDELSKLRWKYKAIDYNTDEEYLAAEAQMYKNLIYSDIPQSDRCKIYTWSWDQNCDSLVEIIKIKVEKAREYLNGLTL